MVSSGWITGMTLSDLHFRVRKELFGSTCTHLIDLIRSVADAGALILSQVTTTRAESRFGMRRDVAVASPSRWDSTSAVGKYVPCRS
jgi:hypothetical protein